jgi:hypothetical protein
MNQFNNAQQQVAADGSFSHAFVFLAAKSTPSARS